MQKRIKIVKGNILDAPEDIILQQVNAQGVMGSGLALQLRNKYPPMYRKYESWCKSETSPAKLLGQVHWYFHDPELTGTPVKRIANICGQLYYGRQTGRVYTDYEALAQGFVTVSKVARSLSLSVAIPFGIGCGLANGDWNKVLAMIESRETFINKFVTIYKWEGK